MEENTSLIPGNIMWGDGSFCCIRAPLTMPTQLASEFISLFSLFFLFGKQGEEREEIALLNEIISCTPLSILVGLDLHFIHSSFFSLGVKIALGNV